MCALLSIQRLPQSRGLYYLGWVPYANRNNVIVATLIEANPKIWRRKKNGPARELRERAVIMIQAKQTAMGISPEEAAEAHARAQVFTPRITACMADSPVHLVFVRRI